MSLLGDPFALAATASLVIQIIVLVVLLYGYSLKRRNKFRQHGTTMLAAVVLHAISIFAVMVPSFFSGFSSPEAFDFTSILVITALIHVPLGIIAFVLGLWIVASWHLQTDLKPCFKKKLVMRSTIIIWIIALLLGVYLYLLFYGAVLLG